MDASVDLAVHSDGEHQRHLLHEMLRIRRFEERCVELYSAQKIRGFLHLYIGEEAVAVGTMQALGPQDAVVATYREHGQAIARGMPMNAIMAEMLGKVEGCSRGRGGSMHLFDRSLNFYGGNAVVGAALPLALGLGLAQKKLGRDAITACFFGDGAVAEGEFHECLNLASLWQIPVLMVCENNRYAMGTAIERALVETDIALRASTYRMPAWSVDGMDVLACEEAAGRAAAIVRGGGPCFVEFRTYRFRAHSMYDPELYRSKEEVDSWRQRDPIVLFTDRLRAGGLLDDEELAMIEKEVAEEIDEAVAYGEAGHLEPVESLTRFIYSEVAP